MAAICDKNEMELQLLTVQVTKQKYLIQFIINLLCPFVLVDS